MDNGVLFILGMLPVVMLIGVGIGLYRGRVRMNAMIVEFERAAMADMTRYLQEKKPVPPPSRTVRYGVLDYEEAEVSKFRRFLWNVYMKATR